MRNIPMDRWTGASAGLSYEAPSDRSVDLGAAGIERNARSGEPSMNLARLLRPELIKLEMETTNPLEEDSDLPPDRRVWKIKETVLSELTDLVASGGRIGKRNKLYLDLLNREKKASTGLVRGIAIPHVRTNEARELLFAFARSTHGIEFDCLDGEPAHLFFVIVAPPYDDTLYLKIYKQMASAFQTTDVLDEFLGAKSAGEVIRAMKVMGD
jgi:mannitol/fructose-specific phosphotransferase system IIA component (Ntr-type)